MKLTFSFSNIGGTTGRAGQRRRFDVRRPSNIAPISTKLCQNAFQTIPVNSIFGEKKKIGEIFWSRKSFYTFLVKFWRIYGQTDLTIIFPAIFRSRCIYYELCTTKNRQNFVRLRPRVFNAEAYPPCVVPPLCRILILSDSHKGGMENRACSIFFNLSF